MRYFLMVLLSFPSLSMSAAKNKPANPCEAQIKTAQKEINDELQIAEKGNTGLEEKVKSLEDAMSALKNEGVFISSGGYRRTKWGMNLKEVLALYPSEDVAANVIKATETIADIPATVEFRFSPRNQLYAVQVEFQGEKNFKSSGGYGKTRWGMDLEEVLALYPSKDIDSNSIRTEETIDGLPAAVEFRFSSDDQLHSVQVGFKDSDLFSHTLHYISINKYLIDKYGKANEEVPGGRKTDGNEEITQADWDAGETHISHTLIAKISSTKHFMIYTSNELKNIK